MGVGGLGGGEASLNCSNNYGNWYKTKWAKGDG